VLGVVLLLRVEVALRGSSKGLAMGIGSAFFSAAFGTWNGSLVGRERAERVTLYELAAAGVACGVCFLAFGGFVAPWNVTLAHWGLFAFLLWPHEERLTARFYVGGSVLIALVFVNGALKSRGR
jgi:drug/metabolite transporter (DMT)-like permease